MTTISISNLAGDTISLELTPDETSPNSLFRVKDLKEKLDSLDHESFCCREVRVRSAEDKPDTLSSSLEIYPGELILLGRYAAGDSSPDEDRDSDCDGCCKTEEKEEGDARTLRDDELISELLDVHTQKRLHLHLVKNVISWDAIEERLEERWRHWYEQQSEGLRRRGPEGRVESPCHLLRCLFEEEFSLQDPRFFFTPKAVKILMEVLWSSHPDDMALTREILSFVHDWCYEELWCNHEIILKLYSSPRYRTLAGESDHIALESYWMCWRNGESGLSSSIVKSGALKSATLSAIANEIIHRLSDPHSLREMFLGKCASVGFDICELWDGLEFEEMLDRLREPLHGFVCAVKYLVLNENTPMGLGETDMLKLFDYRDQRFRLGRPKGFKGRIIKKGRRYGPERFRVVDVPRQTIGQRNGNCCGEIQVKLQREHWWGEAIAVVPAKDWKKLRPWYQMAEEKGWNEGRSCHDSFSTTEQLTFRQSQQMDDFSVTGSRKRKIGKVRQNWFELNSGGEEEGTSNTDRRLKCMCTKCAFEIVNLFSDYDEFATESESESDPDCENDPSYLAMRHIWWPVGRVMTKAFMNSLNTADRDKLLENSRGYDDESICANRLKEVLLERGWTDQVVFSLLQFIIDDQWDFSCAVRALAKREANSAERFWYPHQPSPLCVGDFLPSRNSETKRR